MSGYVGDLSPSQEQSLADFRVALGDVLKPKHDDYLLLQFLRARRFDLKKTEEMFRKHLQFREQFNEEYLLNEYKPPEVLTKFLLPPLLGFDKGGSPVRFINIGPSDIRGILHCFKRSDVRKCVTWFLDTDKELMKKRSKETGIYVETRTFIFDLNGLSLRQIYHKDVYDLVISFLKLYECNYPENLKVAFIINTPSFFAWIFNIIKSLLSDDTVQKLKIFGYSGWQKELLECMDADILPVAYGGTRTDPDGNPRCPSLIPPGGPVPTKYYLKNQRRLSDGDDSVHKVTVGRRSKHSVPLKVELAGSSLVWDVDCKNCDINLYLLYSDGPSPETVFGPVRINSDFGVESGCYLSQKAGSYTLVFDNAYSLLRSKTVLYKTYVSTVGTDTSSVQVLENK